MRQKVTPLRMILCFPLWCSLRRFGEGAEADEVVVEGEEGAFAAMGLGRAFTTALGLDVEVEEEEEDGESGNKENTPTAAPTAAPAASESPTRDSTGGPSAVKSGHRHRSGAKSMSGRRMTGRAGGLPLTSSFLASPSTPTALKGLGAALSLSPLSPLPWPSSSSSAAAASPVPTGPRAAASTGISPPAFSLSSVKKAAHRGLVQRAPHSRSRQRAAAEDGVTHAGGDGGDGDDAPFEDADGEQALARWGGRGQFFTDSDYLAVAPDGARSDDEDGHHNRAGARAGGGEMSVSRSGFSASPHHLSVPLPAGLSSTLQLFSPVKGGDAPGKEGPASGARSERKGSAKSKKTA